MQYTYNSQQCHFTMIIDQLVGNTDLKVYRCPIKLNLCNN